MPGPTRDAAEPSTVSRASGRRFARRARSRRLLAWRPVLVLCGVLAVVGASVWLLLFSNLLVVRQVTVTGTVRLSSDHVRDVAGVPQGVPLVLLDAAAARHRVENLRAVERVEVRRVWPDTVRVEVVERRIAVAVPTGERYLLVDDSGVVFDEVVARPAGAPVLRTDLVSRSRPVTLRAAVTVLSDVPAELRPRVRQVTAPTTDDVTLRLSRGVRVVWGSPEQGRAKGRVLRALMAQRARVYDVSAPRAPAVRR
ncbi:MAG: cell division protein FtsQ/DivIB [Actinomycetes bacterium]